MTRAATETQARRLWRDARFRLIWSGQTASIFGDRVTGMALPWLILFQTHSTFDAGLVSAVRYLPPLALGLGAGLVADRLDRRWLMIACDIGRAGALSIIVALSILQRLPGLWLLAFVVLVLGAGQLGFQVAYSAWLPDITGDETLSRANAALEASDAASTLAGPTLGGALIQTLGPALALGADAISYIVSALTLLATREEKMHLRSRSVASHKSLRNLWTEMLEGVRLILTAPAHRLLRGVSAPLYLSAGAIELLLATLTQLRLHLPAWQAGFVFGAAGIGGLLGSSIAPHLYDRGWRRGLAGLFCIAALACIGLAWIAAAGTPGAGLSFAGAFACNLILDGAVSAGFILVATTNTLITPRALRGRVNAVSSMYSALLRGLSVLATGLLTIGNDPLPMFVLLACCFL
ncbi:MAG TPA: MFS transporter, partial [Ktedonobacteraceae bacterium]|nr:MFS transporter [Ktedonobacteraceae bacterium]